MSAQVRRPEIVVDLAAIRHNVGMLRDLVAPAVGRDGRGQGRRLRPRDGRGRPGRARGGRPGSASPRSTRRSALRDAGDTGRVLCWLTVPGDDYAAAIAARRRRHGVLRRRARRRSRAARRAARRPACSSRSTPASRRGGATADLWPDVLRRRTAGEARRRVDGHRHLVALRLQRRARAPRERLRRRRPSDDALAGAEQAGLAPEVRHLANSAGGDPAAERRFDLVRCGIASYGLDPAPGDTPDLGLEPGDDRDARPWPWSRTSPRAPASPTATPGPRRAPPASGWCRWGTATACRATPATPPRSGSTASGGRSAGASAWTSSSSTSADDDGGRGGRRGRAVRAGRRTASRPRRTGREPCGTINYEIVTRMGGRLSRRYVDERRGEHHAQGPVGRRRARRRRGRGGRGRHGVPRRPPPPGHQRDAATGDRTPFGSLRSPPITVVADDGVDLHVEVDEYAAPGTPARGARAHGRVHPRLLAQPRLAGTSSARPTAAACARCSTTSARTAAPVARRPATRRSSSSGRTC